MVGRRDVEVLLVMGVIFHGFDRSTVSIASGGEFDHVAVIETSTGHHGSFNFTMDAGR